MKIFYIVSIFVLFSVVTNGQAPSWQWAKCLGGYSYDVGTGISNDAIGNVYITGTWDGGTIIFGNDTLSSDVFVSLFIVKYDSSGNVLWARCPEGEFLTTTISADSHNNVYVTGCFGGPPAIFGNDTLIGTGVHDFFIAKYDSAGNVIWAKTAGNPEDVFSTSICTDMGGNILVTGVFDSSIVVFGQDTLINVAGNPGMANTFIVKYSPTGDVIWAKSTGGGISYGGATSITSDAAGDAFITGYIYDDTISFGIDTLSSDTIEKMFAVKYDSSGNVIWVTSAGGNSAGSGIATDSYDNVYITGSFASAAMILGNDTLVNKGYINFFTVKYSSGGTVIWAKSEGGFAQDLSSSIATDTDGNVYVAGYYQSPVIALGNNTFISDSNQNTFVVKYDSIGNVIWAESPDAPYAGYQNAANSISADVLGNVYVTGYFNSPSIIFRNDTLIISEYAGIDEFFVAKLANARTSGILSASKLITPITVYPNPTTGTVYFKGIQTGYTLQVYNVLGEIIYTGTVDRDNYAINLSGKAEGMYFYRIADAEKQIQQGKIILG